MKDSEAISGVLVKDFHGLIHSGLVALADFSIGAFQHIDGLFCMSNSKTLVSEIEAAHDIGGLGGSSGSSLNLFRFS